MITVELTEAEAETVLNALEHYGRQSLTAPYVRCSNVIERIRTSRKALVCDVVGCNEKEHRNINCSLGCLPPDADGNCSACGKS